MHACSLHTKTFEEETCEDLIKWSFSAPRNVRRVQLFIKFLGNEIQINDQFYILLVLLCVILLIANSSIQGDYKLL